MVRSFNHWFASLPKKMQIQSKKWQDSNKPTIQTVNFIVITNIMNNVEEFNPIPSEIQYWLNTKQVEKYASDL